MTADISQAKRYREMVRLDLELLKHPIPHSSNPDIAFCSYLETLYNEAKGRLLRLLEQKASYSAIRDERWCLFVYGAGLFTFGRLDVAEDIIAGIPFMGQGAIRRLAWVLNVLLPMPKGLDVLKEPTAVREWLNVKLSRLKWDESLEKYILENFRFLTGVPIDSNPKQFNATDNGISQKGLIVEILPDTGSNWVGNFQPGRSDFSGVYQHPNRIDLMIISQGQGYIINPENRQLLETFGNNIGSVINLLDSRLILFQNNSQLLYYNFSGFIWNNSEIAWNSVRKIKVEKTILTGEFYRYNDNSWMLFWLDIETNEIQLGEFKWEYLFPKSERPWWQFW